MMLWNGVSFTMVHTGQAYPRISMGPQTLEVGGKADKEKPPQNFLLALPYCTVNCQILWESLSLRSR